METNWGMEEWGKFYMYATGANAKFQDILDVMKIRGLGIPEGYNEETLAAKFEKVNAQAVDDFAAGKMYTYPTD